MKTAGYMNFIGFLMIFFAGVNIASAATCVVTKTTDSSDSVCDGDCSLREAVAVCSTVVFSPGLIGNTVVLTLGEIELNGTTIIGLGANRLTISGNNTSRIFHNPNGPYSNISGVTLTGGNGVGTGIVSGGAIRSDGFLTLESVHITVNSINGTSGSSGGGGAFLSTTTIRNSTFSSNSVLGSGSGSGLYVQPSTQLTIYNSTFSGNSGNYGAISVLGSNVKIRNCTITGNTVGILEGGLSSLDFGNSIIAGNDQFDILKTSMNAGATSAGNNIIGNSSTGIAVNFHPSDLMNVTPALGALQDNGGSTPTMALPAGSVAIDRGSNALVNTAGYVYDQRGYVRIVDGNGDSDAVVDTGAYEYLSTAGMISISGRVFDSNGRPASKALLILSDPQNGSRGVVTNPLGYYRFVNVTAGNCYAINIYSKRSQFTGTSVCATQNYTDFDFTGQ